VRDGAVVRLRPREGRLCHQAIFLMLVQNGHATVDWCCQRVWR
jgi:hypothetical protein